ncbi:MAG: cell envelope integrity protein TolA [Hylemonella sp.]|nr:cell envelope integrity protein TolA [Hylemonella sp.]
MAGRYLFALLALSLLAGCGTPRTQQPLGVAVPEEVRQDIRTEKPLVQWKLAKVTFDKARICLDCGAVGNYFKHYLDRRFNQEFPALLEKKLSESGFFDASSGRSMSVVATLVKFDPGEGDRKIMTSRQLSIRYEFMDGSSVVAVRDITSVGKSNAFQGNERYPEAVDDAITRNIRLLVLSLFAKSNSAEAGRARSEMAAIDAEAKQDLRGSLGGIVLFGAIDSVKAVGSAVGGAVTFVGQNSGAISEGLNSTSAAMDRSNRSNNAAYAQALTASRPQPVTPSASSGSQSVNRPPNQHTAGNTTSTGQRSAGSPASASAAKPSTYAPTRVAANSGHVCPEDNRMFTSADLAAGCADTYVKARTKADAEARQKADEERKAGVARAEKLAAQDKERADKEAQRKAEGWLVNEKVYGDSLEEHQAQTWCQRRVPEYQREMQATRNKLISVGTCSCKSGGAAVSLSKLFRCEFPVTYRAYETSSR